MNILFPFGETSHTLDLDPEATTTIECSSSGRSMTDEEITSLLESAVPSGNKLTLLVPDGTRPLPVSRLLRLIRPLLSDRNVTLFIAKGTHRAMTEEELSRHVGNIPRGWTVLQNLCERENDYTRVGTTERGTPASFHRAVLSADALLAFTLVRPHYYAGYSGGRKIYLPGCASRETIQANHAFVLHEDPAGGKNMAARLGNLRGNPVHEDMMDAMQLLPTPFTTIHAVMEGEKIIFMNAGRAEAYYESIETLNECLRIPSEFLCDTIIVSAGGAPRDMNFVQSHKAVENVIQTLKPGGDLYLYAACPDGLGSEEMRHFLTLKTIEEITLALHEEFRIYGHTALCHLLKTQNFRIHLRTDLPSETMDLLQVIPWNGRRISSDPGRVIAVPDGSNLFFTTTE